MEFELLGEKQRVDFVRKAISDFQGGERLKRAKDCKAYYDTDNPDIAGRKKVYASPREYEGADGEATIRAVAKENRFASNEKVASSFFRDITDAKVQYLAGEGADVNAVDDSQADAAKAVTEALGVQVRRVEQECLTDALVYRVGYAYMQVINGAIKLQHVPYCEVIPYYDREGALCNVLRYWKRCGVEYADYHTPATVYSFSRNPKDRVGAGWKYDGEAPQIITATRYGDGTTEVTGGKGWARLPWFEMRHNNDRTSSLTNAARSMIRCYDIVVSDFANNLIDIQDAFIKLKDSYGSGMEWGEIVELSRTFKASDSIDGVETVEIPFQARQVLADMLRAGIYSALRGVDTRGIASGGVTLATSIRALYADIDLWADQAEWHLGDWVRDVLGLAADYMGVPLPPVNVTFTRRMIFDETAQMDAIARQKGIISDKTLYENHPLVTDSQAELERIAAQELDPAYSVGA